MVQPFLPVKKTKDPKKEDGSTKIQDHKKIGLPIIMYNKDDIGLMPMTLAGEFPRYTPLPMAFS